jgi:transposase
MGTLSKDALIIAPRQELIDTIESQKAQIEQMQNRLSEIEFNLEWFKRQMFGKKSERFISDDDAQTMLDLGVIEKSETLAQTQKISYERRKSFSNFEKPGHARSTMPTHLPFVDTIIEPQGDISGLVRIGEEITWYYDMKPGSLFVHRIIRPKYASADGDGILIGELPALPIDKGNAGAGLMTQVVIDKYVYHLPLDRQRKRFKSEYDVDFAESWLCDIVRKTGFWISGVYKAYIERLIKCTYIQADETPIPVLTRDHKGKTHRGYFWVYHDPLERLVVFDYRESRSSKGPADFLKNFKGVLQVDGYDGYDPIITSRGDIVRAACMDHVRRRFEQALDYDKEKATYALDEMKKWYDVERQAKQEGLSLEQRFSLRLEKSVPSMKAFVGWLSGQLPHILPKSPLGAAITYALNQWPHFESFMIDQRVELSNILIENAIRPIAIGRKNYMFIGSHEAAKCAASIYSLVATAKSHDIDPFVYINDLLTRLPSASILDTDRFLIPTWIPQDKK